MAIKKDKVSILHFITSAKNPSPFDINMAYDAGFDKIVPYTHVHLNEIKGLVQDAIFSRSPEGNKLQAVFIGGRDIDLAVDMMTEAKKGMVPPFEISVFADPSGAFTTAAAMMAKVEQHLKLHFGKELSGSKVSVFGATGPVGGCTAIIAAKYGAQVEMVAHGKLADVEAKANTYMQRYGITLHCHNGSSDNLKTAILRDTDIALCCGPAGVQILSLAQMASSQRLKIVADVNAVPPMGAEGVSLKADGVPIEGTNALGIGALAIGNVKYKTQQDMVREMLTEDKKYYFDFLSAFEFARKFL